MSMDKYRVYCKVTKTNGRPIHLYKITRANDKAEAENNALQGIQFNENNFIDIYVQAIEKEVSKNKWEAVK